MTTNPFLDPALIHDHLYRSSDRLAERTAALHQAKISGSNVATTIADLLATRIPSGATVIDVGCGRGTTTVHLANRLRPGRLIAVDASAALLHTTRQRMQKAGASVSTICVDFHHLPLPDGAADAAVAAFCLYHSNDPSAAVAEIARCLRPGGTAILVTKSQDSYTELDQLVEDAGLQPATHEPASLYETFHSGNLRDIAAASLAVEDVLHDEHTFHFADTTHLARYLATTPKYQTALAWDAQELAKILRERLHDPPYTARSTVSYAVGVRQ